MKKYFFTAVTAILLIMANMLVPLVQPTLAAYAQELTYTPGTYEAEVDGFHGEVKVIVTVDEHSIKSIEVTQSETEGLGKEAVEEIISRVQASQSLNIDAVSGATYSSNAILAALEEALKQSGVDIEALKAVETETFSEELQDQETEVLVIGGGGAGLAAAISAHQNGAKVIVIEKMPRLGGNTIISGSAYNAADSSRQQLMEMTDLEKETIEGLINEEQEDEIVKEWQQTLKEEWEAYKASGETYLFDSPTLHKLQTYNGGSKKGNPKLIDRLAENAYPAIQWLEENGMVFKDYIFTVLGGLWSRAHKPELPLGTGYIQTYTHYIEEHSEDISVYTDTKANKLIVKDGRVVGVEAENNGKTVTFTATKGVILATGGFGANVEMRDQYNTIWPSLTNIKTTNHTGATGDGINLAKDAGAQLFGLEDIQLLPMGDPETGSLSGNIEQGVQNRLFVNKEGKRFVDEGQRRDVMTKALMEQTDASMWVIVDQHSYPTGDTLNNFNESIDSLVEHGRAFKADTLEELAEQIGVDPEAFVASVEEFNKAVDGEISDPFGRTLFDKKIDTAPFYAGARVPTVHHTMGGVVINENAEVLDTNGNIIPGFFAAGEVTGGIHGTNRLGGNALADITVFGRIAGENAAKAE
ncbi:MULTISPECIES: flavocytochrome c [unclassified Facklamia]|uniref:flavocytochrome c n=1 Tax=Aerococcaceae TaxID=186827 RepID=UPI0013B8578F|nr:MULTISPECIES: flavocytochrome c [unclassified Facklamia]NEW65102.1 flavocytochrome c [Facklamia sp. 252]NEW68706.1 flavocytochrome c [Facklamia sp. 253]QQD65499.1 flavocytochrome c [Aerococcaceae bacterium zg-252]